MLLSLICTLIVFALLYKYFVLDKDLPPGPWGIPFLGYLPFLNYLAPYIKMTELAEKYGPIYSIYLGSIFAVVISDPQIIRQAFAQDNFSGRAPLYMTHGIMKGNGIICVEGEKWKETRKFISSSLRQLGIVKFGPGRIKMESDVLAGVEEVIRDLRASKSPIDPEDFLSHALGNVLYRLVFGVTWSKKDKTWRGLQQLQAEGTKLIAISAPMNFLPALRIMPYYKHQMSFLEEGISYTHAIYQHILEDYEAEVKNGEPESPPHLMAAFVKEMRKRGDSGHFNKIQFNFLMADIVGAGVDTTLATIRWFLLFMANNQDWQKMVQEELDSVTEGGSLILDHMHKCPKLEASVLETQRIRPVTPLGIPHGAIEDTVLNGYRIPAGTMIIPLQWAIHMSPKVYKDPEAFNPGRFLNDQGEVTKTDHFLPFQAGKRMCVGEEYARVLLFLFCGRILLEFHVSLPDDKEPDLRGFPGITMCPYDYMLKFQARK